MSPLVIPYPDIDPVLVAIGPFAIRWYALAYVAGLVFAWWLARRVVVQPPAIMRPQQIDDFLFYAALGYEPDLRDVLFDRPRRTVLNRAWPWAIWYPLRRSGRFAQLPPEGLGRVRPSWSLSTGELGT